ncbi:NAD-dependent protein deacylase [Ligilactobacillus salivarius]|uniref:NAD-dependent protein deacylase n=1 Tax=Ligilactobacillus salivarius TaxID=1624 RepID=UPI00189B2B7D|nr:NAD-dependent protein deacylase [Ligilactobacillus salivarius]MDE1507499.1 NAD-dependent protein deacylase [Ligilactobacillus salivarius]MDE1522399.1 NAD-dependent protein deacylase [Ligilactobacillus salivarius]
MDENILKLKKLVSESSNIVFFGGAGVSTESGIPDFRSEQGIYNTVKNFGYPPEQILSHSFFMKNPEKFYDFYRSTMIYENAKPNLAHLGLAKLEKQGKLKAIVTQNIDGLHQLAGSKTVYELHGSIHRNYCMKCGKFYPLSTITESKGVPQCKECGGTIKPDVVLYEEGLDEEIINNSIKAIKKADMLIVGGTSLNVYPAASFVNYYDGNKLILINKSKTPYDRYADLLIHDSIGKVFDEIIE